jgi:hypothetical protein
VGTSPLVVAESPLHSSTFNKKCKAGIRKKRILSNFSAHWNTYCKKLPPTLRRAGGSFELYGKKLISRKTAVPVQRQV